MTGATAIAPAQLRPRGDAQSRPPYTCPECGHLLRVSGLGGGVTFPG